jgi:transcriptional regulator with XRE-family HTH domain
MDLNHKIKQILLEKNLSPSQFADDIGVQRSSISHILAGRNRPSLDIVKKIVNTYTDIEIEWLLDIDHNAESLETSGIAVQSSKREYTAYNNSERGNTYSRESNRFQRASKEDSYQSQQEQFPPLRANINTHNDPAPLEVERILVFYSNGTFKEFKPG